MQHLKFAFVLFLVSLLVFYIGTSLMSATLNISTMPKSIREPLFGIWLGIYVLGMALYGITKNPPPTE